MVSPPGTKKIGRCGEVTVSRGSTKTDGTANGKKLNNIWKTV